MKTMKSSALEKQEESKVDRLFKMKLVLTLPQSLQNIKTSGIFLSQWERVLNC